MGNSYNLESMLEPVEYEGEDVLIEPFLDLSDVVEAHHANKFLKWTNIRGSSHQPSITPDDAILTMEIRLNNRWFKYERVTYNFNELLESIGGLVNATEKLLMWAVVFWSGRMFWLQVVANQFDKRDDDHNEILGDANRNDGTLQKLKGQPLPYHPDDSDKDELF